MERGYRYRISLLQIAFGSIYVGLIYILAWGFVSAGWNSDLVSDRLVGLGLGVLFSMAPVGWLGTVLLQFLRIAPVTTSGYGVTIRSLFKTKSIPWGDIAEFGTYRRLAGRVFVRLFYLKTKKDDHKIRLCSDSLENVNDLIDSVFQYARDAHFVRIENIGVIPFLKKVQIRPWDRNAEL
jgi:hypothetical protein